MVGIVRIALQRPYTFVVLALLILIMGTLALLRTPTDIFPNINIPIVALAWQYAGLPPDQMSEQRITTPSRARADDDGQRHRAHRSQFVHRLRHRQDLFPARPSTSTWRTRRSPRSRRRMVKQMPPGTTPPLILNYSASTVPILQLGTVRQGAVGAAAGRPRHEPAAHASDHRAGRGDSMAIRRQVAPGADRPRQRRAAGARPAPGRTSPTRSAAQNLVVPAGTQKIGSFE